MHSFIKPKPEEIVIVTLDVHIDNGEDKGKAFQTFKKLPVKDKIALIKRKIAEDYPIIKSQNPDAKTIIFVAREYAIQGIDRRSISVEEKQALHDAMFDLTKDKPDLVVMPGSVLIRKAAKTDDQKKLQSYIKPHIWIRDQENPLEDDKKGIYHAEKELFRLFSAKEKYKNTAYVYAQGKLVARVGKIAVRDEAQLEPTEGVTQLAKGKSLERTFTLPNGLIIGVDICNDNNYGLVSRKAKSVDIHFVLSDPNFVILKHLAGLAVHVDSRDRSNMILTKESKGHPGFYRHNILTEEKLVVGTPIYPVQFFISNLEKSVNQQFPLKSGAVTEDIAGIANVSLSNLMKYQEKLNLLLQRVKIKDARPETIRNLKQIQDQFYQLAAQYGLHESEILFLKGDGLKLEIPVEKNPEPEMAEMDMEPEMKEMDTDMGITDEDLLEAFTDGLEVESTDKDLADYLQSYMTSYGITLDTPLGGENQTLRSCIDHHNRNSVIPLLHTAQDTAELEEPPKASSSKARRNSR